MYYKDVKNILIPTVSWMEMITFLKKSLLASKVAHLGDGRGQESLHRGTRRVMSEHLAIPAVLDVAKETTSPEQHPESWSKSAMIGGGGG